MAKIREITTSKDNWSGENVTVKINDEEMSFDLYGYKFNLVLKADRSSDDFMPSKYYSVVCPEWDYPLVTIVHNFPDKFRKSESFEAFDGEHITEDALSRTGECIYSAAIKVLCNTI